ncbi:MAG: hypothetical protein WD795_08340 [Woeseia sp.]
MAPRDRILPPLAIIHSNAAWVLKEFDKLVAEWRTWNKSAQSLEDSPEYDRNTCSEAIKDGRANLNKHELLREKTLVFLRNNFSGAEFIFEG